MIILGIDPGKAIGLCLYDSTARRVLAAEVCTAAEVDDALHRLLPQASVVAIERPRIYGLGGNDIADACEQFGWLLRRCGGKVTRKDLGGGASTFGRIAGLERRSVTSALSAALGQQVRGDSGVWQALKSLHGENCAKKGGALFGVSSHARQALAVAWSAAKIEAIVLECLPF